jgi:hypothetical protein
MRRLCRGSHEKHDIRVTELAVEWRRKGGVSVVSKPESTQERRKRSHSRKDGDFLSELFQHLRSEIGVLELLDSDSDSSPLGFVTLGEKRE